MSTQKKVTRKEQVKSERRRRQNFDGLNQKLAVPDDYKDPNCVYRWVNDDNNRIHDMTVMDDWDIVQTSELSTSKDANDSGLGENVERIVGSKSGGQPLKAFLCKKRKDYHEQDTRTEQAKIDETERAILKGPLPGTEGLEQENSYVPDHGNSIKSSDTYKP